MLRHQQLGSGFSYDLQVIRGLAYAFPMSALLWLLVAATLLVLIP
jgi:hypothetical protein